MTFKINWYTPTKPRHFCIIGHGLLNIGTELLSMLFSWSVHMRLKFGTKITPWGWIFWTMTFFNLKKFTSRSILWRVKLYFESTKEKDCFQSGIFLHFWAFVVRYNFRSWSLSCSNTVFFGQITRNYRFWHLTTISYLLLLWQA